MIESQVAALLARVAAFDRRRVGHADVAAWHAVIGDLDYGDAERAVVAHFRESADWLMPAHVVAGVRELRRARLEAAGDAGLYAGCDTLEGAEFLERLAANRERIASGGPVLSALPGGAS